MTEKLKNPKTNPHQFFQKFRTKNDYCVYTFQQTTYTLSPKALVFLGAQSLNKEQTSIFFGMLHGNCYKMTKHFCGTANT